MIFLSAVAIFCVIKRYYNKHKWKNVKLNTEVNLVNKYDYKGNNSGYNSMNFNENDLEEEDDDFFYNEEISTINSNSKRKIISKGLIVDILINYCGNKIANDFREALEGSNTYNRILLLSANWNHIR